MINQQVSFILNSSESITIHITDTLEVLHPYSAVEVTFVSKTKRYILSVDSIVEVFKLFCHKLIYALDNKACLHSSIAEDIGYLWNEDLQEKPGLAYVTKENANYWIGLHYLLWSTPGFIRPLLDTWIYNNSQGEIILEITPTYLWHFRDPKPDEEYISYDEWIKNYKPLLIRTIPREQAIMWQKQTKDVLEILEKNRLRYEELDKKGESQEQ